MSDNYPLYPNLPEAGQIEAQELVDRFKKQLTKAAEEVIGELYTDVIMYIESDSWSNFRQALLDGLKNYNHRKVQADYDFQTIRQEIYKNFREDIIKDLDQDNLHKIAELEQEVQRLRDENHKILSRQMY